MMMVTRAKYTARDGEEDESESSHSGRLLEDIEAISRALHLHLNSEHSLISHIKSVNRISDSLPVSNTIQIRAAHLADLSHERHRHRNSSRKVLWSWKNSLKSLVRATHNKIRVSFFLHVHSIEGLPLMFNYGSLSVSWKKHDQISQTLPTLVSQGTAKFDETLAIRSTVYGRTGSLHVAKYEPKISLISICVLDEPHLDTGKHWVDLTRLLPLTLHELTTGKSKRSWSTTFPLSGKANGATLNVSFSYAVHFEDQCDSATTSSEGDARFSSVISLPSIKQDDDVSSKSEIDDSLSVLQKNLDDWDVSSAISLETKPIDYEPADEADFDDLMFTVAQQWVSRTEEQNQKPGDDESIVEVIDVGELFSEEDDEESIQDKPCTASCESNLESESVTNEFLKLIGENDDTDELFSPRERLLRQFQDNVEASGSFFEPWRETSDLITKTNHYPDDFDFCSPPKIQTSYTATANAVEDNETEELLREWGLSENSFQKSPRRSADGFGSPIELFPEAPVALPLLGLGLSAFAAVKSGGFLQSMKPSLFTQSKTSGSFSSLIIQVSGPVVLPPALGSEFLEIAQHLGYAGADELAMLTNSSMPMEDLKGKRLLEVIDAKSSKDHYRDEWGFHYVTSEEIIPLMIDKISDLLIEGLRVQSAVSDTRHVVNLRPRRFATNFVSHDNELELHEFLDPESVAELESKENTWGLEEMFAYCIPLDEWVRLDAGVNTGGDVHGKCVPSILSVHNGGERSEERGLFEGTIAVSMKVQLRDPARDYEPVGAPMLAVVRLERKFIRRLLLPSYESEDSPTITDRDGQWCPCFKILDTHVSGVRVTGGKTTPWGTRSQHVSGTRWLASHGMTESNSTTTLQSQVIVVSRLASKTDCLWSLSLSSSVKDFYRNPNIILN